MTTIIPVSSLDILDVELMRYVRANFRRGFDSNGTVIWISKK